MTDPDEPAIDRSAWERCRGDLDLAVPVEVTGSFEVTDGEFLARLQQLADGATRAEIIGGPLDGLHLHYDP